VADGIAVARVRVNAQAAAGGLQTFLRAVASINLAQTVDIDGVGSDGKAAVSEAYMQSVHHARALVRQVEAAAQALYDDGAVLLVAAQYYPRTRPRPDGGAGAGSSTFQTVAAVLRQNTALVLDVLEALLLTSQEQADKGQHAYRGSIDWRASRLLSLDPSISQTLSAMSSFDDAPVEDAPGEDEMVDWGAAITMQRPTKTSGEAADSSADEAAYGRLRAQGSALDVRAPQQSTGLGHRPTESFDSTASSTQAYSVDDDGSLPDDDFRMGNGALASAKSPSRADKIIKLFGDVPSQILNKIQAETLPWYLRPNYSDQEILIDPDGKVRGGTLPALVERLTAHEHIASPSYSKTFLMTFKSFTELDALFDLLVQRFWIAPPDGLTPQEFDEWKTRKRDLIRTRCVSLCAARVWEGADANCAQRVEHVQDDDPG
jgi:son of sevenless-like protein